MPQPEARAPWSYTLRIKSTQQPTALYSTTICSFLAHTATSQQIIMPEPHHEDPASSPKSTISQPKSQQRRNPLLRWTTVAVTLPPPIFFVPLLLAAIYFLFSSSLSPQVQQQSCSLQSVPQVQTASLSSSTPKTAKMSSDHATEQT